MGLLLPARRAERGGPDGRRQRPHARLAMGRSGPRRDSVRGLHGDGRTKVKRSLDHCVGRGSRAPSQVAWLVVRWTARLVPTSARRKSDEWTPPRARAARYRAPMQGLAPGGGPSDADEQPRPGGGRAPRRPGRLRRHGPGRAVLGCLRRHRPGARGARGRRDAARAVGQGGRQVPHTRRRAARAHRQQLARAGLGDLGEVPGSSRHAGSPCSAR